MIASKRKTSFPGAATSLQEHGYMTSGLQIKTRGPVGGSRGRAQVKVVCGTFALAIWSCFMVLWICSAMPDTSHSETATYIHGHDARPFANLLLVGVLLLCILCVYGFVWPHRKCSKCSNKSVTNSLDVEIGIVKPGVRLDRAALVPHSCTQAMDSSISDSDDDSFVSCDELSDVAEVALPGTCSIAGFFIEVQKLPEEALSRDYEAVVKDLCKQCSSVHEISMQQSLRLALGLSFDTAAITQKWRDIRAFRDKHEMDKEHARCKQLQLESVAEIISFPHQEEVYRNAFAVSPCALVSCKGEPISIWHVGTGSSSASSISVERVEEWARSVFEYVDVWVQLQSRASRQLIGHIQVFDMSGVGLRHVTNSALHERFKRALGCGGNYVELVSHIYVINSSWVFSKVWNIVKTMISPRTSSKVTVTTDVPQELLSILTRDSARMLPEILRASGRKALPTVQRPPQSHL